MNKIIILRFFERNKIKDIEPKLKLTQDIISDRTTQALNIILNYIKSNNIDIEKWYDKLQDFYNTIALIIN